MSAKADKYLRAMQRAAYTGLRKKPPEYSVQDANSMKALRMEQLAPGGVYETRLQDWCVKQAGFAPGLGCHITEILRVAEEQMPHNYWGLFTPIFSERPAPIYSDPRYQVTLSRLNSEVFGLHRYFPHMKIADMFERVTVGTLPTGSINAITIPVPDTDEFLIVFDPMVFGFLRAISKDVADTAFAAWAMKPETTRDFSQNVLRFLEKDRAGGRRFFVTISKFVLAGQQTLDYPLPEKSREFAECLYEASLMYLLLHEYGHLVLGHLDHDVSLNERGEWERILAYNEEYGADRVALDLLESVQALKGIPPEQRYLPADNVFLSNVAFEGFKFALKPDGDVIPFRDLVEKSEMPGLLSDSHPHSGVRFGKAHGWLKLYRDADLSESIDLQTGMIAAVFEGMWASVRRFLLVRRHLKIQPVRAWRYYDPLEIPESWDIDEIVWLSQSTGPYPLRIL